METNEVENNLKADNLSADLLAELQSLIDLNVDSANGFKLAASTSEDTDLKAFFIKTSEMRADFANALQQFMQNNQKTANFDGSLEGTLHRWWLNVRATLSPNERHAILAEAERGEDSIKHEYEDALKTFPGTAMQKVLQSQYVEVKKIHDKVRSLRDAAAPH